MTLHILNTLNKSQHKSNGTFWTLLLRNELAFNLHPCNGSQTTFCFPLTCTTHQNILLIMVLFNCSIWQWVWLESSQGVHVKLHNYTVLPTSWLSRGSADFDGAPSLTSNIISLTVIWMLVLLLLHIFWQYQPTSFICLSSCLSCYSPSFSVS